MKIVPRAEWGARPPTYIEPILIPTPELWLHHTAGEGDGPAYLRAVQGYHMDVLGWSDIGYSFLVDDDGQIFEGRGAGVAGGHTWQHNTVSHAICAMGNYQARDPSPALLGAIADLVRYGHQQGWWPATITGGHRDANPGETECPGDHLYARIEELNGMATAPPATEWAALTNNDTDFAIARDTVHLGLGLPILGAADAGQAKGALYVGAFDTPPRPWEKHLATMQATGQGADRTRALMAWWVRAVQAVGLPPL